MVLANHAGCDPDILIDGKTWFINKDGVLKCTHGDEFPGSERTRIAKMV
jgi:hypothetical protein